MRPVQRRAVRVTIRGRVQGVGYRWWAVRQAELLRLDGWVRNRSSGEVELMAIGASGLVEQMIAACRSGPPGAAVAEVIFVETTDDGAQGFVARATL
jgi:acylphosphatase